MKFFLCGASSRKFVSCTCLQFWCAVDSRQYLTVETEKHQMVHLHSGTFSLSYCSCKDSETKSGSVLSSGSVKFHLPKSEESSRRKRLNLTVFLLPSVFGMRVDEHLERHPTETLMKHSYNAETAAFTRQFHCCCKPIVRQSSA